MITFIKLSLPDCTFLRDPQETKLGMHLITESLNLLDEIGFESFTFKKLAQRIDSTEASIYRYFENKQQLLLFLYTWYWSWMSYRLQQETHNVSTTAEKLNIAIRLLITSLDDDLQTSIFDEKKLKKIVGHEGIKSLLTKNIDSVNNLGAFENYKQLVEKIASWITELNPDYIYPNMLVTTIIEGSNLQHFFRDHLPRLSNNTPQEDTVGSFFTHLIESVIFQKNTHGNSY